MFRFTHLCIFSLSLLLPVWVFGAAEAGKPNILLIVAEDLSNRVGAFGDIVAKTPTLDQLAQEGVRFTGMYSAAGVCAPNRSALITGVYPHSMGTQHMRTANRSYQAVPPAPVKAFPELLRAAGYATANTSKTDYQFGEPFTIWDVNTGNYATPPDLAVWRQLPDNQPFFAMINLMSTHESQLTTPNTQGKGQFAPFIKQINQSRAKLVAQITHPELVKVPPYYPDTPQVRASLAQHYDNIHFMDQQVAKILEHLEADRLTDKTIVIWTTDHGDGLPRAKRSVYDSGLHVPLIIRFAENQRAGEIDTRLISAVDLAPLILSMAGVGIPDFIQGRNVLSDSLEPRHFIFAGRDRMDEVNDRVRAVRGSRYKFIRNYMPEVAYFRPLTFRDMFPIMQALWQGQQQATLSPEQHFYFAAPRPKEELYDTVSDPHEVNNLADHPAHAKKLQQLREQLDLFLNAVGDRSKLPEEQMINSMWPAKQQPKTAPPQIIKEQNKITLTSATAGASLGYRIGNADKVSRWRLYTAPLQLNPGQWLEAKAVRYGYAESEVSKRSF